MVERPLRMREVRGSMPLFSSFFALFYCVKLHKVANKYAKVTNKAQ